MALLQSNCGFMYFVDFFKDSGAIWRQRELLNCTQLSTISMLSILKLSTIKIDRLKQHLSLSV
jgi:hypothetical protein